MSKPPVQLVERARRETLGRRALNKAAVVLWIVVVAYLVWGPR